jgi:hypothetical protein
MTHFLLLALLPFSSAVAAEPPLICLELQNGGVFAFVAHCPQEGKQWISGCHPTTRWTAHCIIILLDGSDHSAAAAAAFATFFWASVHFSTATENLLLLSQWRDICCYCCSGFWHIFSAGLTFLSDPQKGLLPTHVCLFCLFSRFFLFSLHLGVAKMQKCHLGIH